MLLNRALIFTMILAGFACKKTVPDSELVAKVNGEGITKVDFDAAVERNMARYRGQGHTLPPGIEQRIKESVLRRLIDDGVIAQKAKGIGVAVTDEELEVKFQEHKKRFRTDQAFDDYLKRSNNTVENMKKDIRRNQMRDRVVEKLSGAIEVTDEDVKKYYDENQQRFKEKEQIKVARVLVRVPHNAADGDKAKAKTEAANVLKLLKKADADFGEIARTHSKGPEATRRGELGWLTRGRMPPEFDNVAFNLEVGVLSEVVETKLGFEIIKVAEKKAERQREIDEVKENIKNSLIARKRNEKRREVLRDLKKDAQVEQLVKFERPQPTAPGPRGAAAPGAPSPVKLNPPRPPAGQRPIPNESIIPAVQKAEAGAEAAGTTAQ